MSEPNTLKKSKLSPEHLAVARRLRQVRMAEEFSLEELATEVGLTKSTLKHYEYGATPVTWESGRRLCERLDLNQRWLATGDEPKRPFVPHEDLLCDSEAHHLKRDAPFLDAYRIALQKPLEKWVKEHPMELLVRERLSQGVPQLLQRFSMRALERFIHSQLTMAKAPDAPRNGLVSWDLARQALEEFRNRLVKESEKSLAQKHPTSAPIEGEMNISDQIKKARAALGLTQTEAAEQWGVPRRTLQNWELGVRTPRGLALAQLETILKASNKSSG